MKFQYLKQLTKNMRCENRVGLFEYELSLFHIDLNKPAKDLIMQESLLFIQRKQQPSRRVS